MELSIAERNELDELEATIEQGLRTFYEVGNALLRIRDGRLYRATHETFEEYCRDRWEMTHNRADRLIRSSNVVRNLVPMGTKKLTTANIDESESMELNVIPTNERQARPLTQLGTVQLQREAWQRAVETAPDGKVTAIHVARVVKQILEPNPGEKLSDIELIRQLDPDLNQRYAAMYNEMLRAKLQGWTETPKAAARQAVKNLKKLVR